MLTEASYTILIQALAEAGSVDQAVGCLDVMHSEGLKPNVISYAAAMAACRDRPEVFYSIYRFFGFERKLSGACRLCWFCCSGWRGREWRPIRCC